MSVKQILPILVLVALVIGIAACQPNTAEEAVGVAVDRDSTVAELLSVAERRTTQRYYGHANSSATRHIPCTCLSWPHPV